MTEKIKTAIIGGGVIGCAMARELSQYDDDIYLFEKNPGITQGENQSSRNSGVNHAGIYYDQETRPLKARLCVEGNRLWYEFCQLYDLPCRKVGKLMVGAKPEDEPVLELYLERARDNGVPGVRKITGAEVREFEPNVKAYSALLLPTSGIFEATSLVRQLHALADNNGVQFLTGTEVTGLKSKSSGVELRIRYRDGAEDVVEAERVINAAGVFAVDIALMVDPAFPITTALVRADAKKFLRTRRPTVHLRGMNVYPTPIVFQTPTGPQHTVGVHLTPTFDLQDGQFVIGDIVTVGPQLVPVQSLDDIQTPTPSPEVFLKNMAFFPDLKPSDLEDHQGAVQARLVGHPDFYLEFDRIDPRVFHLVGCDSPGFTSALAIAKYAAEKLKGRN